MLTMSETEVAMSSMIMSSSVLAGCMIAAKYSVMLGELHLAKTDTSCKDMRTSSMKVTQNAIISMNLSTRHKAYCPNLVDVFDVVFTAPNKQA